MTDAWCGFDLAVGLHQLGKLPHEALADAAAEAMVRGLDTPALARLAGLEYASAWEIEPVLMRVYAERGRLPPGHRESTKLVADDIMRRMVDGRIAPEEGSDQLWKLTYTDDADLYSQLAAFDRLHGEWSNSEHLGWEHEGHTPQQLRARMRETAEALLAAGGLHI
jgi:hypothetical protein